MIETREHLIHVPTEAAQIEHNLLCSYLYAALDPTARARRETTLISGERPEL